MPVPLVQAARTLTNGRPSVDLDPHIQTPAAPVTPRTPPRSTTVRKPSPRKARVIPRDCAAEASINSLLARPHASLSYLSGPAPTPLQLAQLQASVAQRATAPTLRLVECDARLRAVLDIVLARHALRTQASADSIALPGNGQAPMLLALMTTIDYLSDVSPKEQAKQAGAALADLLIVSHQLGFATAVQAGPWCMDTTLRVEMGLAAREFPAAFVHVGRRHEAALR